MVSSKTARVRKIFRKTPVKVYSNLKEMCYTSSVEEFLQGVVVQRDYSIYHGVGIVDTSCCVSYGGKKDGNIEYMEI